LVVRVAGSRIPILAKWLQCLSADKRQAYKEEDEGSVYHVKSI